ncbi:MAG: hypothetical protein EOM72_10295 [Opitutae bacterium]|nr:hypothetical protein [Opitutae bacterium]
MRLPPNRLFFFLPLLLFAGSAPALAAQTWTTVWTPNSTPAVRTTNADSNTHESKTNYRPCEVWDVYKNSGKGGWDPLPANTEPIQCAGDTNDYTCKVCDGIGGVTNATDYTPCGTCGCCEGGNCVEYTNNCPNPRPIPTTKLNKVGPCPCTDPTAGGCVIPEIMPIPPPMPEYSAWIHNCKWVPVLESFMIDYKEGLCLDRCQTQIASASDVTSSNVCAVKQALQDRINAIMGSSSAENPAPEDPPPPEEGAPDELPPIKFCFTTCMQAHEDTHVEQLKEVWQEFWDSIYFSVYPMSVPFNCDDMRTDAQAIAALNDKIQDVTVKEYMDFIKEWHKPGKGEAFAYFVEAQRLQELLDQIQPLAADNGCP